MTLEMSNIHVAFFVTDNFKPADAARVAQFPAGDSYTHF
jgi:hypothetical protein